jgi:transposase
MNKGQFRVTKRTQKDYPLAFKLQVVEEVESGELSQHAACHKYGIQARSTVLSWLRKHGRLNWHQNTSMSKKTAPNKKITELEKKIKRLQAFRLVEEAVQLYNQRRPHLSLKMKTPNSVHLQKIPAT